MNPAWWGIRGLHVCRRCLHSTMKVRVILLVVLFLLSSLNLRVGHAQIDATLNPTPTPSERSPTSAPAFTGPVQSSTARPTFVPGTSCTATDDAIALIGDGACNDYSNSNTTDMNSECVASTGAKRTLCSRPNYSCCGVRLYIHSYYICSPHEMYT